MRPADASVVAILLAIHRVVVNLKSEKSLATKNRFHIVPIRIENKGGVIAGSAQTRCPVVRPTSPESGCVERIHFGSAFCCKSSVLSD
jgi:hypothetical protein